MWTIELIFLDGNRQVFDVTNAVRGDGGILILDLRDGKKVYIPFTSIKLWRYI